MVTALGQIIASDLTFFPGIATAQIALDLGKKAADIAVFVGIPTDAAFLLGAAGGQQKGDEDRGVAGHLQSLYIG